MSLNNTPHSNRLHITLVGRRNSGKSSLVNALTDQYIAVVSDTPGTTTDPVLKAMEMPGIGPCLFIDTPGLDDEGPLGELRIAKTKEAMEKTDITLLVCTSAQLTEELHWLALLKKRDTPTIVLLNQIDRLENPQEIALRIEEQCGIRPLLVSATQQQGIEYIRQAIIRNLPEDFNTQSITGNLVSEGDVVLLVMPQDIQAPKGRLILPQVQTLRELLDKKCLIMSCTTDKLPDTLKALAAPPKLIITDSQVFKTVYEQKPEASKLTSFSVLFAGYKGDIDYYIASVTAIDELTADSRILIAEACTHAPQTEDIGRVKIPRLLRNKIGERLQIDFVSGSDFPDNLAAYHLIIQCGACMFNRKYVLNRIEKAKAQNIPMTNYGIAIAYLNGILDRIDWKSED